MDFALKLPTNFNYTEPLKRIHDSQALHRFQSSLALNQLQITLSKIVALVESKDIPAGVLHKEDLYTDEEIAKYEHDLNDTVPIFKKPDNININDDSNSLSQLELIYKNQPIVKSIVELLNEFSNLIDLTPPFEGPRRYGNFACRDWHTKVEATIEQLIKRYILQYYKLDDPEGFIKEIKWYISNSFGSKERLDFGTGHELNFLAFISGLWKVEILKLEEFNGYDILVIFGYYYNVVRKLITTYTLEPAGSHGVWGLDDHLHIIYILGASQILKSDSISPNLVNNKSVVYRYSDKNFYFNSIAFIYKVKKGPFFEHSPILYDVSHVKSWEKILKGLLKMFQVEVIGKFPVVQHFYFGNVLFPWEDINGVAYPIDSSEKINEQRDHLWQTDSHFSSEAPVHQIASTTGNLAVPGTSTSTAPWARAANSHSISLQDRLNRPLGRDRAPPSTGVTSNSFAQTTTRAPWSKS